MTTRTTAGQVPTPHSLEVPSPSASDAAHRLLKAVASAFPLVGGTAAELLTALVQPPLERRRDKWMQSVSLELARLTQFGTDLDSLKHNEEFGLCTFSSVTTSPGLSSERPTRLVALDVLGVQLRLPEHQHQPQARDVETDRDHVRRKRAVDAVVSIVEAAFEPPARLGHLVGRHARGQLQHLRERGAVAEQPPRLTDPPPRAVARDGRADLLFQDATGPRPARAGC